MSQTTTRDDQNTYVALLRGINVGGHKRIKMAELREMFEALGFERVRTLLATGNVIFSAPATEPAALRQTIESALQAALGYEVSVTLRTLDAIRAMVAGEPFNGIDVTPDTRLYVTFLNADPASDLEIPYASQDGNFRILRVADRAIYSVLTLSSSTRTVDLMGVLEKEFGKDITTRNWNTVTKIATS